MKKVIKSITLLLAIIVIINIFSRIHISYEEFAYKTLYGIIKGELNDKTYAEVNKFIDKEEINKFLESTKQFNYPNIEMPDDFRTPILNEKNNHNLVNMKYYLNGDKWIKSSKDNGSNNLEYNLDLSRDSQQSPPFVEVNFHIDFVEESGESSKWVYGRISILLDKIGFNKYEIKDISIYNLRE